MHVDTPATIAVLGAGPVGLEAALYARYLGYDVQVYERGRVGESLRDFAHLRLFSPWGMNISPLGLAALSAQDANWHAAAAEKLPTAGEFVDQYLVPLSKTDLLAGCVHESTEVLHIGRESLRKLDRPASEARARRRFRLLLRDGDGCESIATADVVIDATGTYGNPAWAGDGGIPALGERRLRKQSARQKCNERDLEYGLPDILGAHRKHYAGKTVMVVGAGHSAATNVLALLELAQQQGTGQVVWVTRRVPSAAGIVTRLPNDPLPQRQQLAEAASQATNDAHVQFLPGWVVQAFEEEGDRLRVKLARAEPIRNDEPDVLNDPDEHEDDATLETDSGDHGDEDDDAGEDKDAGIDDAAHGNIAAADREQMDIVVDRVLANVGYRPDRNLYRELQVHACYASEGIWPTEADSRNRPGDDGTTSPPPGPEALLHPEPNFYVLGAKSYGRNSQFLIADGLNQIRDVFRIIGGRDGLDVYATMMKHS